MRIAPVAWVVDGQVSLFEVATRSAAVTHNHLEGIKGTQAVASAIRLAVSLGGDSDTQAAIAGSVAEAFYGGVPIWLLEKALPCLYPFLLELCYRFTGQYMPGAIPEQVHL